MGGLEIMMTQQSQQEIRKIFGDSTGRSNAFDVVHGFLWDSLEYCKGGTIDRSNSYLFRDPIGSPRPYSNGASRTWADTNMTQAGRLDAPEAFAVQRILFTFAKSCCEEDMYTILESFMFRFWLGCKYYVSITIISLPTVLMPVAPIRICEYCQSVYANTDRCPHCGATHFKLSSLGGESGGTQYILDLGVPLQLLNQVSFYGTLEGNQYTFQQNFKMWVHLEGLHARGKQ